MRSSGVLPLQLKLKTTRTATVVKAVDARGRDGDDGHGDGSDDGDGDGGDDGDVESDGGDDGN